MESGSSREGVLETIERSLEVAVRHTRAIDQNGSLEA